MAETQLPQQQDHLAQLLQTTLRDTLFSSRAYLHPSQVKKVASALAEAFFEFDRSPDHLQAESIGIGLCHAGVGIKAVLRIGSCLTQFCKQHSRDSVRYVCIETTQVFHGALVQGYLRATEANILQEQERIRSALQQTLHRYTLQLETAAEVARTATSTLELGTLLTSAVDLIGERFGLDYVAVYLLDQDNHYADLRAATGKEGRVRLSARHRLRANGASTVGRCLASKQHVLMMARSESGISDASWLAETQSEIVLPLVTHGRVIGALSAQSQRSGTFSSQDVTGFQIMSDQLANAIQNARLYANAQQRAEDLSQAYVQLKELENLKDQFMQNVSHELRTPLTMIRGYAEMLLLEEDPLASSEWRDALQIILRNALALSELVTDIMVMLEASASRSSVTTTSLLDAVQDSANSFLYLAQQRGLILELDLPTQEAVCDVLARSDHLHRITDNLLSNAMKFTPAGGRIQVRVWESDGRAFLEVADTGIGIPSHLQERIFERFFQVDSSNRRTRGGVGLGLALVRELVESYGGRVSAASPGIDQGSVFTVILPCAPA